MSFNLQLRDYNCDKFHSNWFMNAWNIGYCKTKWVFFWTQCTMSTKFFILLVAMNCLSVHSWLIRQHGHPVRKTTEFKTAVLTYKILATHQPTYLFDTLLPYWLQLCALPTSNFFSQHTWILSLVSVPSTTAYPRYGTKSLPLSKLLAL